jgi:hypothetical protein
MAVIDAQTLNERSAKRNALLNAGGNTFRKQNILDSYVTYSYHHMIIASNNTEALRQIQSKEVSFESISSKKHGDTIPTSGNAPVYMVINTTIDSRYFITSLSYDSLFVNTSDPKKTCAAEQNMHMTIKEAGGATFINYLRKIADEKLQCSFDSICMQLFTFFVGHTADGQTETIPMDPIGIAFQSIESTYDHTGGAHNILLQIQENGGPFHNPATFYANRGLNLVIEEKDLLLSHAIKNLETKLNEVLEKEWQLAMTKTGGNGRKVQYKFTWPDEWDEKQYSVTSNAKDNYIEKLFEKEKKANSEQKNSATEKNPNSEKKPTTTKDAFKTYLNFSIKLSIPQILAELFKHCKQIHDAIEANKSGQNPPKLYQVIASTTSDLNQITVHIDIMDYYLPNLGDKINRTLTRKGQTVPDDVNDVGLEFDFIFTGLNTDIMNLEMKTNYGNQLVQDSKRGIHEATDSFSQTKKSVIAAAAEETKSVDRKATVPVIPIRKYDPIYMSYLTADAEHGYIYAAPDEAKARQNFIKNLAYSFTWSNQQAHITIRGNPIFMKQMIRKILPHDDKEYEKEIKEYQAKAKAKAEKKSGDFDPMNTTSYMGDVSLCVPLFVKVNVYTPVTDDEGNTTGYEPFWYNGWWIIKNISSKFADGEFTQDLYLLPYGDQTTS